MTSEITLTPPTLVVLGRTPRRQWPAMAVYKDGDTDWIGARGDVASHLAINGLEHQAHAVLHRRVPSECLLLVLLDDETGLELRTLRPQGRLRRERR